MFLIFISNKNPLRSFFKRKILFEKEWDWEKIEKIENNKLDDELEKLENDALNGDPNEQAEMANLYLNEKYLPKDPKISYEWAKNHQNKEIAKEHIIWH